MSEPTKENQKMPFGWALFCILFLLISMILSVVWLDIPVHINLLASMAVTLAVAAINGKSYCATCDGAFYKDRIAVVVGGGNVAAEDAVFLSGLCEKVYLVHRRDTLRADKALQEKVFACENIEMVWDSIPQEILGQEEVTGLKIRNVKTGEERELEADGVFIAVGIVPSTALVKDQLKLDENGYICAGEEGVTSAPGVFAAGDIRTKALRQVVTAVSDGANAVASAQKYLWRTDNGNH